MILSPRVRIVAGLVGLLSSLLVMALILKLIPDPREVEREWRGRLCETMAVNASVELSRNDLQKLQAMLTVLQQRHADVLSAALRQSDGAVVAEVGPHGENWQQLEGDQSSDSQITVPLRNSSGNWGKLEVRFTQIKGGLLFEMRHSPMLRLLAFLTIGGFVAFYFYLGKVLEQLNPNKAIPGRVRSALDTLAEGLLVLDRKGRIVLCNQALAATLGESAEKLTTKSAAKLPWVSDPNNPHADVPWRRVLAGEPVVTRSSLRLRNGQGEMRIFVVNCSPVLTPENEVRGAVCSFEDITVLESQKVELAHSKAEAEAANEAKSQFLANMSHEIRTPMNAILGFTEILRRGMCDSDEQRLEFLHTIYSSGQHLLRLINDILDLSKVEAGKLEVERIECSPHEILHDVVAILRVKANEKSLSLTCVTPEGLPEQIVTDPGRLRQILTNLIGNAIKFTESGGVSLVVRLSPDQKQLVIDVTDTGVGISTEAQQKIFEPFMQADGSISRRFGGTGLGLTITKKFAESLGGDIAVRSEPGQGSTFTVRIAIGQLPSEMRFLTMEEFIAHTKRILVEENQKNYAFPAARILLADDGEANRQLIELVLRRNGLPVTAVTNGQEALDAGMTAAASGQPFEVILMDMQMPVMDGYEATQSLRQNGITAPIIALTANVMRGDEEKCRAAGCTGFLPKPVELDRLVATLAEILKATEVMAPQEVHRSEPTSAASQSRERASNRLHATNASHVSLDVAPAKSSPLEDTPAVEANRQSVTAPANKDVAERPKSDVAAAGMSKRLDSVLADVKSLLSHKGLADEPLAKPRHSKPRAAVTSTLPLDDPEFREIVVGFAGKLRTEVQRMSDAWEARDLVTVGQIAHWLKGAAGTMGFREFTEPATRLMSMARDNDVAHIDPVITEILELTAATSVPA